MSASHRKPKRSRPSTIEQAKVERAVAGSPWPARPACGLPTLPVYEMALSEPVKPAYDKAWPLNEDEIDLPTEPPAPDLWAAEDGDYLGTITIFPRALRRCPLDLDVMRLANGDVALGPFEIPRLQARALIQLINAAYQEPVQEGRS